jgi:dipeptidyl aminopeptidase/acylaminoacyl peptidase
MRQEWSGSIANKMRLIQQSAACKPKRTLAYVCEWAAALALVTAEYALGAISTEAIQPMVKDIVEFRRVVHPSGWDSRNSLRTVRSPDGRHAFIVTMHGNLAINRNQAELLLLDTDSARLTLGRSRPQELLLTAQAPAEEYLLFPPIMDAHWTSNSEIVFRAQIEGKPFQIYKIDIDTRKLTQLTFSDKPIWAFRISDDLKHVVYVVMEDSLPAPASAESMVVGNLGPQYVLFYPRAQRWRYRYFVAEIESLNAPRPLGDPFFMAAPPSPTAVSPDGQWAILKFPETDGLRVRRWVERYPPLDTWFKQFPSESIDPLRYIAPSDNLVAMKLVRYRLADGESREVFDAPHRARAASQLWPQDQLWQPPRDGGGPSVIIADTFIPVASNGSAATTNSTHLIEYWPESGKWSVIEKINAEVQVINAATNDSRAFEIIDGSKRRRFKRESHGKWSESAETNAEKVQRDDWTLKIVEELNQPPRVVAVGPEDQIVKLTTELNPRFSANSWGNVQPFSWKTFSGQQWNGGLILPNDTDLNALFSTKPKLPLVIQTYGFDPQRFYLDAPNINPIGNSSAFAGRAFVREGILVLQMHWRQTGSLVGSGRRHAARRFIDGVNGAIDTLVTQGVVDENRIGIIGFSMTGGQVQQLLTFGDASIRAATIADGVTESLWGYVAFSGWEITSTLDDEQGFGALPFGETASQWVARDPSLSTHCVKTALRVEAYGKSVHPHWDTYALLRRQYKPAEMIVFPNGAHNLARPSERMISLQGNVDWFNFWLQGKERTEVVIPGETKTSLEDQYKRWRQMAELKTIDDKRPRCPPNRWMP